MNIKRSGLRQAWFSRHCSRFAGLARRTRPGHERVREEALGRYLPGRRCSGCTPGAWLVIGERPSPRRPTPTVQRRSDQDQARRNVALAARFGASQATQLAKALHKLVLAARRRMGSGMPRDAERIGAGCRSRCRISGHPSPPYLIRPCGDLLRRAVAGLRRLDPILTGDKNPRGLRTRGSC